MRIVMFTNTYAPHVGGVARSVRTLADGLERRGHAVLIVAPDFGAPAEDEERLFRVPAIQRFNGSDFALPAPFSTALRQRIEGFAPELVHAHHPFLLGGTALRVAEARGLPILYTAHTRYDLYDHYLGLDWALARRLARRLVAGYCNLCDAVIAPSASTAAILREWGVSRPLHVIPTPLGLPVAPPEAGAAMRRRLAIPEDAPLIGHAGRLAPEKNLAFLARALAGALAARPAAHALIVGDGPMAGPMRAILAEAGVAGRVHMPGVLRGEVLAAAYAAMDVFAFSSHTETQGLVLIEAMAAGVPVVALDAPGSREALEGGRGGRLLAADATAAQLAEALLAVIDAPPAERARLAAEARARAAAYAEPRVMARLLALYRALAGERPRAPRDPDPIDEIRRALAAQWKLLTSATGALGDAVSEAVGEAVAEAMGLPARDDGRR